jgi:DNA recombination protein RmuC
LKNLGRHIIGYDDYMKKLGTMSTTVNHYNNAYKEFKKIDKDVAKITEKEAAVETMVLDKPKMED